jgi:hypothetical protein
MTRKEKKMVTNSVTKKVTSVIELITPDKAARWLSAAPPNRNINRSHIEFFKRQLTADQMQITSDGIALDENEGVTNGQHRLTACVETGIAFQALVVRGISHDTALKCVDSGRVRTEADRLGMIGETNTARKASIGRGLALLTNVDLYFSDRLEHEVIYRALEEFRSAVETVIAAPSRKRLPSAVGAVAAVMIARGIPEFWHGVLTGEGLSSGDPRLLLRTWLLERDTSAVAAIWSRTFACADAYLNDEKVYKLMGSSRNRYTRLCADLGLPVNTSLLAAVSR